MPCRPGKGVAAEVLICGAEAFFSPVLGDAGELKPGQSVLLVAVRLSERQWALYELSEVDDI